MSRNARKFHRKSDDDNEHTMTHFTSNWVISVQWFLHRNDKIASHIYQNVILFSISPIILEKRQNMSRHKFGHILQVQFSNKLANNDKNRVNIIVEDGKYSRLLQW